MATPRSRGVMQRGAARSAGTLWIVGGIVVLLVGGPIRPGVPPWIDEALAVVAVFLGVVAFVVPWHRLGRQSTLSLLPVVLALVSSNDYINPDPYTAGAYYIVIGVWIGLYHRRWTTAAFAPLIALSFWLPRAVRDPLPSLPVSTAMITVVSVMVGEILAATRSHLLAAQREVVESRERRVATLAQGSNDVTLIVGSGGVVVYASPSVRDVLGDEPRDLEGRVLTQTWSPRVEGLAGTTYGDLVVPGDGSDDVAFGTVVDVRLRRLDGRWINCELVVHDRSADPDIGGIVVHLRDVDHRKQLEQRLHHMAYHDDLTGLGNRILLREQIDAMIASGELDAVVLVGIDEFKHVNDSVGHRVGDEVLRAIAGRLAQVIGDERLIARLAGDEFALLVRRGRRADELAQRAIDALAHPFQVAGASLRVSAGVGIARCEAGCTSDSLLQSADTAMQVAKASSSRCIVEYEHRMGKELLTRLRTESEIRLALQRDEFVVHYQPKVDLLSGAIVGTEALARWMHPSRGLLAPVAFIDVAEETGLIVDLGRSVLEQACRQAATWQAGGGFGCEVAVNVSPRQFDDSDLLGDVRSALGASGLDPSLLTIEVTESLLVSDIRSVRRTLERLKDLGVSLALDDFGTGYASLRYLQQMPFDMLKIDRSFVSNLDTNAGDLALVRAIVDLGQSLGLTTLAEGVETVRQVEILAGLGCDLGQGYLYAKPLPPGGMEDLWSARRSQPVGS